MTVKTENCSPVTKLVLERREPSPYKIVHLVVNDYFSEIATGYDGDYRVIPENQETRDGDIYIHLSYAENPDWYRAISDGLSHWFGIETTEKEDLENWKGETVGKVLRVENP